MRRPASDDAEISFVMRDLAAVLAAREDRGAAAVDEVMARVREAADWTGGAPSRCRWRASIPSTQLAYAAEGDIDPYAGFESRIVPENITLLPKTATPGDRRQYLERAHA